MLTAIFADPRFGGTGIASDGGIIEQLFMQLFAIAITIIWSGLLSYILFKLIARFIGLRVLLEEETNGLDISQHDQQGYNL